MHDIVGVAALILAMISIPATLCRWWVFQCAFITVSVQNKARVVGYRPGSRFSRVAALIAFPITSCYAAARVPTRAPVAGDGTMGSGLYTFLTFIFVKPFIIYSVVVSPFALAFMFMWWA